MDIFVVRIVGAIIPRIWLPLLPKLITTLLFCAWTFTNTAPFSVTLALFRLNTHETRPMFSEVSAVFKGLRDERRLYRPLLQVDTLSQTCDIKNSLQNQTEQVYSLVRHFSNFEELGHPSPVQKAPNNWKSSIVDQDDFSRWSKSVIWSSNVNQGGLKENVYVYV